MAEVIAEGQRRDLRPEAQARRSDCRRHARNGRRHHRAIAEIKKLPARRALAIHPSRALLRRFLVGLRRFSRNTRRGARVLFLGPLRLRRGRQEPLNHRAHNKHPDERRQPKPFRTALSPLGKARRAGRGGRCLRRRRRSLRRRTRRHGKLRCGCHMPDVGRIDTAGLTATWPRGSKSSAIQRASTAIC